MCRDVDERSVEQRAELIDRLLRARARLRRRSVPGDLLDLVGHEPLELEDPRPGSEAFTVRSDDVLSRLLAVAVAVELSRDPDWRRVARTLVGEGIEALARGRISQPLVDELYELHLEPHERVGFFYDDLIVHLASVCPGTGRALVRPRPRESRRRRSASRCRSPGRSGADDPSDLAARRWAA
jgi:hypothetical protein